MIKLSLFNAGVFHPGNGRVPNHHEANAILDSIFQIVVKVESLGFHRYWLGEHYELGSAWHNTEILLALLAGCTERIRIGVAGVLLHLGRPLRIAQDFKMLEHFFPERIDLGIARGTTNKETIEALWGKAFDKDKMPIYEKEYEVKLEQLLEYITRSPQITDPITVPPYGSTPEIWILGTGKRSSELALKHKLSFCLGLFHESHKQFDTVSFLNGYRNAFESKWGVKPNVNICIAGVCAATEAKAKLVHSLYPSNFFTPNIIGGPDQCKDLILGFQQKYDVEEVVFMDLCYGMPDKLVCYEYLAPLISSH